MCYNLQWTQYFLKCSVFRSEKNKSCTVPETADLGVSPTPDTAIRWSPDEEKLCLSVIEAFPVPQPSCSVNLSVGEMSPSSLWHFHRHKKNQNRISHRIKNLYLHTGYVNFLKKIRNMADGRWAAHYVITNWFSHAFSRRLLTYFLCSRENSDINGSVWK